MAIDTRSFGCTLIGMSNPPCELFDQPEDDRTAVNGDCVVRRTDQWVVVLVKGLPVFSYETDDVAAMRLAMVQLVESKIASQEEIARAFGVTRLTVYRQIQKYRAGGVGALVPKKGSATGPGVTGGRRDKVIVKRKQAGESNRRIATRLGISEPSVRRALKRMGYQQEALSAVQPELVEATPETSETSRAPAEMDLDEGESSPVGDAGKSCADSRANGSEQTCIEEQSRGPQGNQAAAGVGVSQEVEVAVVRSADPDPACRWMDRLLARAGLLEDAGPLFGTAHAVPGAGVLLAIPVLVKHGVFADAARVFGSLGSAFYGVRNVVLTLLICFLRGINRPENLKRHAPCSLGQVLGLDRAPEMKTLRRKIRALAAQKCSLVFARVQMKRHLSRLREDLLWVYVDGHVAVYSGKEKLAKHHVTRLRLSMPSVLDYWVNDAQGDPLFVFSGRVRKGMVAVLKETIEELRRTGERRVITLVFDREGWSPGLFAELSRMEGIRFVTYRKAGRGRKLPRLSRDSFEEHRMVFEGQPVRYELAERTVRIDYGPRKKRMRLELRQVTRLNESGKQTHVVTNDRETSAVELAHRMFSRWGQENFFRYMGEKRDFDGLVTYLMEDADAERQVPNPDRAQLREQLKRERSELERLTAAYGSRALDNEESCRPTMRGFKIANGQLGQQLRLQRVRVEKLEARLKQMPATVPLSQIVRDEPPKKVDPETRRLIHLFEMSAHRAESALRELFRPVYPRWHEESREMVRTFLNSCGDLDVAEGQLRVTLHPQASPHRTRVLAHLCCELNTLRARFPGSDLVLQFAVQEG